MKRTLDDIKVALQIFNDKTEPTDEHHDFIKQEIIEINASIHDMTNHVEHVNARLEGVVRNHGIHLIVQLICLFHHILVDFVALAHIYFSQAGHDETNRKNP